MIISDILLHAADLFALGLVIVLIWGYHLYLRRLARNNPSAVLTFATKAVRSRWVEALSESEGALLAVQTLRNSSMAASFLASTTVLLMMGALTLTGQSHALEDTWKGLNLIGTLSSEIWLIKILCVLLLLFFAFFNLLNAIRVFNHVGYMVAILAAPENTNLTPTMVGSELNRGHSFFTLGVRSYYYLIPLVFWLFGPIYMIASACVLVFVLLPRIDKTPHAFGNGSSDKK